MPLPTKKRDDSHGSQLLHSDSVTTLRERELIRSNGDYVLCGESGGLLSSKVVFSAIVGSGL